ncbi:hypothetical protein L484_005877 [Morus notabilis]|uniref:Early nodulin-93 n=1 Tax=Morus notabilis TaxID=981085 RepID=W9QZB2_9ROSA|nr:hypothetical protein L484_005877 [Morus notabilis]
MGIPSEMRDFWANRREASLIPSPIEERKISNARHCTQEGLRAGFKAASIACVASAVPTAFFEAYASPVKEKRLEARFHLLKHFSIAWE